MVNRKFPYKWYLTRYSRKLRHKATRSERILWQKLRKRQVLGYRFNRQKPIDNYILDFFCHELMIGIELDGSSHDLEDVQVKDAIKEKRMRELGIRVLRFKDEQVFRDLEGVVEEIERCLAPL